MDSTTARQTNFLELFRQFREKHADQPDRGMLKKFAEALGLSERYLSHVKCGRKPIGHATARHIEEALKLPTGWMDVPHTELEPRSSSEKQFVEMALALYRANAVAAQDAMLSALKTRLATTGGAT